MDRERPEDVYALPPNTPPKRSSRQMDMATALVWIISVSVLTFVAGLLAGMWAWPDDTPSRWQAIEGIGSIAGAAFTAAALAGIWIGVRTLKMTELQGRMETLPYLRLYVGFQCALREPSFRPPDGQDAVRLNALQFVKEQAHRDKLAKLDAGGKHAHVATLWVENVQDAPLGAAIAPEITLFMRWAYRGAKGQNPGEMTFTLVPPYVLYNQPLEIELLKIGTDVEILGIASIAIQYRDVLGRDFTGATGPASFGYRLKDPIGEGEVLNAAVTIGKA